MIQSKVQTQQMVGINLKVRIRRLALAAAILTVMIGGSYALQAIIDSSNSVTLIWTAPGDDGNTGQASSYDIRYSPVAITAQTFDLETAVGQPPRPLFAGQTDQYIVKNLLPDTEYFFAIKSADKKGNTSPMSNVVSKKTTTASALPLPQPSTGAAAGGAALALAIIVVLVFRSR